MAPGSHDGVFQVDSDAVPILRGAFVDALAKLDRQLELADRELRLAAWARDPVSQHATGRFNERSVDDLSSAVESLRAYREQLDVAVFNLDRTAQQYRETDDDNSAGVNKKGEQ